MVLMRFVFGLPNGMTLVFPGWESRRELCALQRGCCLMVLGGPFTYPDGFCVGRFSKKLPENGCIRVLDGYRRVNIVKGFCRVLLKGVNWVRENWGIVDETSFDWDEFVGCLNWVYCEAKSMKELSLYVGRLEEVWCIVEAVVSLIDAWSMELQTGQTRCRGFIGNREILDRCICYVRSEGRLELDGLYDMMADGSGGVGG